MHWILAHFIGDYILQNDFVARNKKSSSLVCAFHVFWYMLPFLLCGLSWLQLVLIAIQHFLQDRTEFVVWFMKAKGSGKFAQEPFAPWSIIVTDNILHIAWMWLVIKYGF